MASRFFRPRSLTVSALAVAVPAVVAAAIAIPGGVAQASAPGNQFRQTNLISDLSNQGAQIVDPSLKNSWGLTLSATSPLWVADNATGLATVYSIGAGGTSVTKAGLTVTVPGGRASTSDGPSPTGEVFNGGTGFVVSTTAGSGPARFIFDSESGQISGWNPAANPNTAVLEYSSPTAVYKGLAMATTDSGTFLYATNFHDGTVDVFNSNWQLVRLAGDFTDPNLPPGYAPFGIANINGLIYVSYAVQDADSHDDVAGAGHGFIDVYTNNGLLVERLVSHVNLNSPWGLAEAPAGFGAFGGDLLVGNFGNGEIHAFGLFSGVPRGTLKDDRNKPIQIDGLWGLQFGTASTGGTGTLLFSAGLNDEQDGLVGAINPVP
ncbi:MAG TPA: TIGR03118 family protein [Trebonia sp.]|jgi:uncharacterized protein (TIGR03118 family)